MNLFIWMIAGMAVGYLTFAFMQWNESRGLFPNVLIGGAGGMIGGKLVAPMFTAVSLAPADFRLSAAIFAVVVAIALLAIANLILIRWEI